MDRYGDAIEADLHSEYGLDLLDFFRRRYSRRKLLNLIERLPAWSQTVEARVNDDELADTMLESVKDLPDNGPRISEYTPVVERLDTLADMLSALQATVIAAAGGKPGRQRPAKRPSTAISRAQKARADRNYTDLLSEVEAAQERWQARTTE